jgi:hypothetical protein
MQMAQRWGNRFFSNNELSRGAVVDIPRFQKRFAALERFFQLATPKWLDDRLDKAIRRQVKDWVGSTYSDSNARTSELIGIDLAQYGYSSGGQQEAEPAAARFG